MNEFTDEYIMSVFCETFDVQMFDLLTKKYSGRALGVARQYLFDKSAAEDAVQETFLKVIRYRNRFDNKQLFAPWFFRMLRNVCIDMLRKNKVQDEYIAGQQLNEPEFETESDFESSYISKTLLDKLPLKEREVLVLRIIQDMPIPDIAVTLKCSVEAVKKRSQRGLKKLRIFYNKLPIERESVSF
jgi:RNA polymerase sigma factor (sigma-70 family)